jgi:hypothetical protein
MVGLLMLKYLKALAAAAVEEGIEVEVAEEVEIVIKGQVVEEVVTVVLAVREGMGNHRAAQVIPVKEGTSVKATSFS